AHYAWIVTADGIAVCTTDGPEVVAHLPTATGSREIAFSADSRWAFVLNATESTLTIVDVHTLAPTKVVALDAQPLGLAYSRLGPARSPTDPARGEISVIAAVKHDIITRIPAAPGIAQLRFTPGQRFGLIANPLHDSVLVLDASTHRIIQQ